MSAAIAPVPYWPGRWTLALLLTLLIAALIAFWGALGVSVYRMWTSSPIDERVVAAANTHPSALLRLGAPIATVGVPNGNIWVQGEVGNAQLVVPVAGSLGSGSLHVSAKRRRGIWRMLSFILVTEEGERIDLLNGDETELAALDP